MGRYLRLAAVCGSLLAAAPAFAETNCTRDGLEAAVNSYVAAQTNGTPSTMQLASGLMYRENMEPADISRGILNSRQKIDLHRSIYDTTLCESFTEVVITDPAHPYVLGTRLKLLGGKISEIETLVTDHDDWLFNAANTYKYSAAENWSPIPADRRHDRATLISAAKAYLDLFEDKSVQVPWGTPCARLEGGIYTAKGRPDDTCNVGVPDNTKLVDRRFIVDETLGSVVSLLRFGKNSLPDSHLFRVENGKLRYVHTITVCKTFNCGFPVPEQLRQASGAKR
jgi:hypothetical protein